MPLIGPFFGQNLKVMKVFSLFRSAAGPPLINGCILLPAELASKLQSAEYKSLVVGESGGRGNS